MISDLMSTRFGVPGACLGFGSEGRGVSVWRTMSCFSRLCAERRETQVKKEKEKKRTAVISVIFALRLCVDFTGLCA